MTQRPLLFFAEDYFLATRIDSDQEIEGCTFTTVVVLPGSNCQVHFTHSSTAMTPTPDVNEWVFMQEKARALRKGKFDQYMSNSLVLWASSLDPLVQRFRSGGQPFLALDLGADLYGLFVSVPKNSIVFQIRSRHLTEVKPSGGFNACASR